MSLTTRAPSLQDSRRKCKYKVCRRLQEQAYEPDLCTGKIHHTVNPVVCKPCMDGESYKARRMYNPQEALGLVYSLITGMVPINRLHRCISSLFLQRLTSNSCSELGRPFLGSDRMAGQSSIFNVLR